MSSSLKSGEHAGFHHREDETEKNGLRICPINDDLAPAYTWATPENGHFTGRCS